MGLLKRIGEEATIIGKAVGEASTARWGEHTASAIGKRSHLLSRYGTIGGIVGAGAAIAQAHPVKHAINFGGDAVLGTQDADNAILGTDLGLNDILGFEPPYIPQKKYFNETMIQDAVMHNKSYAQDLKYAQKDVAGGYAVKPFLGSNYPYQPDVSIQGAAADEDYGSSSGGRSSYSTGATGDMVFGMFNLRTR